MAFPRRDCALRGFAVTNFFIASSLFLPFADGDSDGAARAFPNFFLDVLAYADDVANGAIRVFDAHVISAGEIADIGMICGGDVRVFFQYFAPEDVAARRVLRELPTLLDASAPSHMARAKQVNGACPG